MYLRKLELKDMLLMLEWMHDPYVIENMKTDFASKTILDCELFILNQTKDNIRLAKYMGTVSLKLIIRRSAEFGTAVCKRFLNISGFKWKNNRKKYFLRLHNFKTWGK